MKTFYTITLCLIFSFTHSIFAQNPPDLEWEKTLGGSYFDEASSVQQTADGGYIVAGFSGSHDGDVTGNHLSEDFWVVKLSADDSLVWQTSLGGYDIDAATSIHQTPDGGYVVAGYSSSVDGDVAGNNGNEDVWVVKLNSTGAKVWQKTLGGSENERCESIAQTSNGNFILGCYSSSSDSDLTSNHGTYDFWLVSISSTGNLLWQKNYGGSDTDLAYSAIPTSDGGYIIAGTTHSSDGDVTTSFGGGDVWVVKTDSGGNMLWEKSYGGTKNEQANAIIEVSSGGYMITGITYSMDGDVTGNHGLGDCWMLRIDTIGNLLWQKCLGSNHADGGNSLYEKNNNEFIVAGICSANGGDVSGNHGLGDFWVLDLDSTGGIHWQQCYGGTKTESAFSIKPATNGYIVAGYTKSNDDDVTGNQGQYDYWVVKLCSGGSFFFPDADGDGYGDAYSSGVLLCSATQGFVTDSTDCDDTDPLVNPGMIEIPGNGIDDNCNGYTDEIGSGVNEISLINSLNIFPNPATEKFYLQLQLASKENADATVSIQNLLGENIFTKTFACVNGKLNEPIPLDKKFAPGMYLVTVNINSDSWNQVMMVSRK